MIKIFGDHIKQFERMLHEREHFAFARYSDGELYILQNKELVLDRGIIKIGDSQMYGNYKQQDYKHYDPKQHSWFRDMLLEAYKHQQYNYFKGISCRCCVGEESFNEQLRIHGGDNQYLTWANLFVNGNYPYFIEHLLPIIQTYESVMVCHQDANLDKLEFVVKDFRVGYNAMINDYNKVATIREWIVANNIKDHLFLFSASTFSNIAIYELYRDYPNNTYIDIGTCLTPFIDMPTERQYLQEYWFGAPKRDTIKNCIW